MTQQVLFDLVRAKATRQAMLYRTRKDHGVCVSCGTAPPAEGGVNCQACYQARLRRLRCQEAIPLEDRGLCCRLQYRSRRTITVRERAMPAQTFEVVWP